MEKYEVPYENYTLPTLKMNPEGASKGVIVAHGGFDSNYEEFFPQMMYLRQLGYTVYLFEGPGQGACLRTDRRSPRHHPLRVWLADQSSVSVNKGKRHGFL